MNAKAAISAVGRIEGTAIRLSGQIALLPEIERPVSRLNQFGGGFIPPAVALEIEHLRNQSGLTQRELAARIGVSQGQLANALRGHDPLSSFAVNRLRETLGTNTGPKLEVTQPPPPAERKAMRSTSRESARDGSYFAFDIDRKSVV